MVFALSLWISKYKASWRPLYRPFRSSGLPGSSQPENWPEVPPKTARFFSYTIARWCPTPKLGPTPTLGGRQEIKGKVRITLVERSEGAQDGVVEGFVDGSSDLPGLRRQVRKGSDLGLKCLK